MDFTTLDPIYARRALENTQEINYKTLFLLQGKIDDLESGHFDPVPEESSLTEDGKTDLRKKVSTGLEAELEKTHHAIAQCAGWLSQLDNV